MSLGGGLPQRGQSSLRTRRRLIQIRDRLLEPGMALLQALQASVQAHPKDKRQHQKRHQQQVEAEDDGAHLARLSVIARRAWGPKGASIRTAMF